MPRKTTLSSQQLSALHRIQEHDMYAEGRDMRDVRYPKFPELVPARNTMISLWRKDLIEFAPNPTLGDAGTSIGHQLQLTPQGRTELQVAQPQIFSTSWRVDPQGEHPRRRARQLKEGDLVLMPWTDGRKEWRRVTAGAKPWTKSMPDWVTFATQDTGENERPETHNLPGHTRYTVVPAGQQEA